MDSNIGRQILAMLGEELVKMVKFEVSFYPQSDQIRNIKVIVDTNTRMAVVERLKYLSREDFSKFLITSTTVQFVPNNGEPDE